MAKLKHVALCIKDARGTAAFFKKFFEMTVVEQADTAEYAYAFLTDGDMDLALLQFKTEELARKAGVESGRDYVGVHHIGFLVDDPRAMYRRLKEGGAEIPLPLGAMTGPGVYFDFKVRDPNGILIDVGHGWPGAKPSGSVR
ncbi:MAG: VOC family protein [Deltaproteobacteria bacterium]|nr:VOC family protein [Deltaproteobacteria bacterium]